jgi:hypothetical protein
MANANNERRRFDRVATDKPVVIRNGDQPHEGIVVDVSLRGALLDVSDDDPWRPANGDRLIARIKVDRDMCCIDIEGEVAHVEGSRIGLQCLVLDLESASTLRRLVELNLADPELLERNLAELTSH